MKEQIKNFLTINNLIPDNLKDKMTYDLDLIENSIIESFNIINLVVFLEQEYHIKFEPRDMAAHYFKSINTIEQLIVKKQQNE